MATELTASEIAILNNVLHRLKYTDDFKLVSEVRGQVNEDREGLMALEGITEKDFDGWQAQATRKISDFLAEEGFVHSRDEVIFYLTQKGKNLKKQGSFEKYQEWLRSFRAKNKKELHLIETRGYLDQDEIKRNRPFMETFRKYALVPAIAVLIVLILAGLEHKYKFIDKNPTLKHLLHSDK